MTHAAGLDELGWLIAELPAARLEQVFTHASWADDRAESYERLEFLGDSVLELAIARAQVDRFADAFDALAKIRVTSCPDRAVRVAKELGLGERLLEYAGHVAPDEPGGSRTVATSSPLLEAAIAAVYLEHGFERIEPAIVGAFAEKIEYARSSHVDYKTELQEALARSGTQVSYTVLEVEGPPHDRQFVCAAHVAGTQLGMGRGTTKKPPPSRKPHGRRSRHSAWFGSGLESFRDSSLGSRPSRGPVRGDRENAAPVHLRSPRIRGFKSFPGTARDHARAWRGRHRRPERLGQVEHRRRRRLGGGLADAVGAARREARRRPFRRRR